MKNKKPSLVVLSISLILSIISLVLFTLGLFGIVVPYWIKNTNFNFLIGFVLIVINLLLDIAFMVIEKKKLLIIPEWFRVVFFIGFLIFTVVYYYFNLFNYLLTKIVLYVYLATVLSILSISIFFNVHKNDKNVAKTSNAYAGISTFTYATSMFLLIETVVTAIKIIINGSNIANGLSLFLIKSCTCIFVCLMFALAFYISLSKTKKFVNACLIQTRKEQIIENK